MTPMRFIWWDAAVGHANVLSCWTRLRHKVSRVGRYWVVDLADEEKRGLEVCS